MNLKSENWISMPRVCHGALTRTALLAAAFSLVACGGGGGAGSSGGSATPPTAPAPAPIGTIPNQGTITIGLTKQVDNTPTSSISLSAPAVVRATFLDSQGRPVPNTVVSFSSSDAALVSFQPAATALTDAQGVATVTLIPASLTAAGAFTLTATGTLGTTTITRQQGIAIGATTVNLTSLDVAQTSIGAFGTTTVQARVTPTDIPVTVQFSSVCATRNQSTITQRVDAISGVAVATYTANGCSGQDQISASVVGINASRTANLTVAAAESSNIQFVSAAPQAIVLSGTGGGGLSEVSTVTFQVVNTAGQPVSAPVNVNFSLTTSTGGIRLDDTTSPTITKQTDANGRVSVQVQSGTLPTPVAVTASLAANPAITTQSNRLTISTGRPTQSRFSLSVSEHNIEGWSYDGVTSTVTVNAADRLGNLVADGTSINFISEGAAIQPTCSTVGGTCAVTFRSQNNRPGPAPLRSDAGRITVLAYAVGEESFVDTNGNNRYDAGETFQDLGFVFVDAQDNANWEQTEQFVPFGTGQNSTCVNPPVGFSVPSRAGTCDGVWGSAHVRQAQTIVLSGSVARFVESNTETAATINRNWTLGGPGAGCSVSVPFVLQDENANPMPARTTIALDTSNANNLSGSILNPVIGSTSARGGTGHAALIRGTLDTTTNRCTGGGTVLINVTTPRGNVTAFSLSITAP